MQSFLTWSIRESALDQLNLGGFRFLKCSHEKETVQLTEELGSNASLTGNQSPDVEEITEATLGFPNKWPMEKQ